MKKNSINRSVPVRRNAREGGFFNLRVLIGLLVIVVGVSLAVLATAKPPQKYNAPAEAVLGALPPGFDCFKIHELGIDKQDNMRAGAIMIACGLAPGGSPAQTSGSYDNGFSSGLKTSCRSLCSSAVATLMSSFRMRPFQK